MSKKSIISVVIILLVIGVGVLIYNYNANPADNIPASGNQTPEANNPNPDSTPAPVVIPSSGDNAGAMVPVANTKEFTVTGQPFSFTPSTLTVNKGDKVKITFKNANGFHDLKIDEFNVATSRLNAGGQETVEFIANKTGAFEYYCSVGNHRAMGMKGTLTVK